MNATEDGPTINDLVTRLAVLEQKLATSDGPANNERLAKLEQKLAVLQAERAASAGQTQVHQSARPEKALGHKHQSRRRLLGKGLGVAAASLGAATLLEVSTGTALADGTQGPTTFVNNGANAYPVFAESTSAADGIVSISTGGSGIIAEGALTSSYGVIGISPGNLLNGGAAVGGFAFSTTDPQAVAVYGNGQSGAGVVGVAQSGAGTGVEGSGNNTNGTGVSGLGATGVVGQSTTSTGIGVKGSGFNGVRGETSISSGAGVLGVALSPATLAGYFAGNVQVTGSISKGGGTFKIDHPQDPANKYLSHSFVESPDQKNVYDGLATLDAKGEAVVTLPAYFGVLNKDFRYQLTAIGAAGPNLHIATKISNNSFTIAGGTAGMEVCWLVTGIRHDAFALANPVVVEQDKPANERGRYLHPTLYGHPESDSVVTLPNVPVVPAKLKPVAPFPIPKVPTPPHK